MEPIINPTLFYWMEVCYGIKIACGVIGGIMCCVGLLGFVLHDDDCFDFQRKNWLIIVGVGGVLVFICIFIPCYDTLMKMLIVSYITPDNIAAAGQSFDVFVSHLIEQINNAAQLLK